MRLDFPNVEGNIDIYMRVLRAICGDTAGKSMIDLCCAFAPNTPKLGFEFRRYVDIIDRKLDHPQEQQFFTKANILDLPDDVIMYYNVSICSDGIEHFYPVDGRNLINIMKSYSFKQIIFTPLGEIFKLHNTGPDDPEAHHSLWTPDDFQGWACIVFPHYHRVWNGGAFFAWHCEDIDKDFERVKQLLNQL
jgi:hypothetical protein